MPSLLLVRGEKTMITGLLGSIFAKIINSVLKTFLARADQRKLARLGIDKEALQNALKGEKWRRNAIDADASLDVMPGAPEIGTPNPHTCPICCTSNNPLSRNALGQVHHSSA